jgi:hypothetical protein
MPRLILMAGTIIASSLGFALAGLVVGELLRSSRRRAAPNRVYRPRFLGDENAQDLPFVEPECRGYDTPELYREDTLARKKQSGNDRDYQ